MQKNKIDFTEKRDVIEHFKVQIRNQRGRVYKEDTISFMYNRVICYNRSICWYRLTVNVQTKIVSPGETA